MPYELAAVTRYPYGPAARFSITGIQPPATGYLGPSDQLSISVLSPNVDIEFSVALRYLDLQGNVQPLLTKLKAPATGATPFVLPIQLAEGFLLSAVAFGAKVKRGQCWVQFVVLRQKSSDAVVVADVLLQGYVSATDYVAWPGTPIVSSIEGPGFVREIKIPQPPEATDIKVTVPPATRWRLISVWTSYSDPSFADQIPVLVYLDPADDVISNVGASEFTTASPTFFTWSTIGDRTGGNVSTAAQLAQHGYLPAGFSILLSSEPDTSTFQQIGAANFMVEEWVEL